MKTSFSRSVTLAGAAALAMMLSARPVDAATILVFGQSSGSISATNPTASTTQITASNLAVTITNLENLGASSIAGLLDLTADSDGAATGGPVSSQFFDGSFTISWGAGNFLTGTFDNAVGSGPTGGAVFSLIGAEPPNGLDFSESGPITSIFDASGMTFSFSNITTPPGVHVLNGTIQEFTSNVSGNFSANSDPVPEPASMMLLGSGLLGLAAARRRRMAK